LSSMLARRPNSEMTDWGTIIKRWRARRRGLLIAVLLLVVRLKRSIRVDKREAAVRAVLPKPTAAPALSRCNGYAAAVRGKARSMLRGPRPDVTHRIATSWAGRDPDRAPRRFPHLPGGGQKPEPAKYKRGGLSPDRAAAADRDLHLCCVASVTAPEPALSRP